MKVAYRQAALDDVVRQFRYYLLTQNLPDLAIRFRAAVQKTILSLQQHPLVGPLYSSNHSQLQNFRTWPVTGFEAIRIYYRVDEETLHIARVLHGKRDVKRILERDTTG